MNSEGGKSKLSNHNLSYLQSSVIYENIHGYNAELEMRKSIAGRSIEVITDNSYQ